MGEIPPGYRILEEGKAKIIYQDAQSTSTNETAQVFYNPVQEFNRDISVLAISEFN